MLLDLSQISSRTKLILAGLFLAKYDSLALKKLGFDNFIEAFNVIGYALGGKPMAIKNYRDEFDPLFPNPRRGWHKRPRRAYCMQVMEDYQTLDLETFTALIKSFVGYDDNLASEAKQTRAKDGGAMFAQRLVTGLAAECYFEAIFPKLSEFDGFSKQNTTRLGCGYDFRLQNTATPNFFAVEVKGMKEERGSVSLTPKEYDVASRLKDRFFLFVVKNFRESPFHIIYQNPLESSLQFSKKERVVVATSWLTTV